MHLQIPYVSITIVIYRSSADLLRHFELDFLSSDEVEVERRISALRGVTFWLCAVYDRDGLRRHVIRLLCFEDHDHTRNIMGGGPTAIVTNPLWVVFRKLYANLQKTSSISTVGVLHIIAL